MRVGLVGCGRWGANVARDLRSLGAAVATADPRTGEYASLHHLPPCGAYVVATPATSHANVLRELLAYDKPVFCEKPLATSSAELLALSSAAHERVFVMDKWRYHPAVEELGRLARDGSLGKLATLATLRLQPREEPADADCTWVLLPHELAIAREVCDGAPVAHGASASLENGRPVELISLYDAGETHVSSKISVRDATRRRAVAALFAEGVATFRDDDESAILLELPRSGKTERIEVPFVAPLRRELEAFLAYARGAGPPPKSSFADGVESVRTIERLRELAGIGQEAPSRKR